MFLNIYKIAEEINIVLETLTIKCVVDNFCYYENDLLRFPNRALLNASLQ